MNQIKEKFKTIGNVIAIIFLGIILFFAFGTAVNFAIQSLHEFVAGDVVGIFKFIGIMIGVDGGIKVFSIVYDNFN